MPDPDPAGLLADNLGRPGLAVLPVLFLMRIGHLVRRQSDELNPRVVKQEHGLSPEHVPVRPDQVALAGRRSRIVGPFAEVLGNDVIVVHSADDLPALWKLPVLFVELPSVFPVQWSDFAAGRSVEAQAGLQQRVFRVDLDMHDRLPGLVSQGND